MPATSQYSTPPNFPYFLPIAQIPVKPDFPLITSKCLQPNNYILINNFYKWEFKKSTLKIFIDEFGKYFSENPPFTLENAKNFVYNNYFIVFRTIILNTISNTNF